MKEIDATIRASLKDPKTKLYKLKFGGRASEEATTGEEAKPAEKKPPKKKEERGGEDAPPAKKAKGAVPGLSPALQKMLDEARQKAAADGESVED